MFGIRSPSLRANSPQATPHSRAIRKLDGALADLAAPWRVLRNRRARPDDGPPWTKYIALHPEKGIALIDLVPANPYAAVGPLDEFLARTGFAAFSRGDPPIAAVAVTEREIPDIAACLTDAFVGEPPCGIENASWVDAVIELLMSTPGLLLTSVEGRARNRVGEGRKPDADRADEMPPVGDIAPQFVKPTRNQPFSSMDQHAPKPRSNFVHDGRQSAASRPSPSEAPSESQPSRAKVEPVLGRSAQAAHEPTENRSNESQPTRAKVEPVLEPGAQAAHEPTQDRSQDSDWRIERMTSFEHKTRRRRGRSLWLFAGSLAGGVALAILYLNVVAGPTPTETASLASGAPAAAGLSNAGRVESLLPPANEVTVPASTAPPPQNVTVPPQAVAKLEAPPTNTPPPRKPDAMPPSKPAASKPNVSDDPATRAMPAAPVSSPRNTAQQPKSEGQKTAASKPKPPTVATKPPVILERSAAADRAPKEARLKPMPQPRQETGERLPKILAPEAPALDAHEETVTIDGTTYVKGREPHALGSITEPPSSDDGASLPVDSSAFVPRVVGTGDNQVLIQPE